MASSKDTFCDICQAEHVTIAAEEYCPQCEEALCVTCHKHHKLSKATKAHQTITILEYNTLPPFIRSIKQYCDEHGDLLEFYCTSHDDICCKRCVTSTHQRCQETRVIQDYLKNSSSSTALVSLEKSLEDIETNIMEAIKDRKNNLEAITEQRQEIETKVKSLRQKINDHLEKLEQKLVQNITEIENKIKQEITELINNLEQKKQTSDILTKDTKVIKKYASSIQVFMGTRELGKSVNEHEHYIQSIYEDKSLSPVNLVFELDKNILNLTNDVQTMGTVSVKKMEPLVSLRYQPNMEAQMLAIRIPKLEDLKAKHVKTISVKSTKITGCVRMQDGSMFFMTETGRILKYASRRQVKELLMNGNSFDATVIDNSHIAITSGDSTAKTVSIVNTKNLKTDRTLSCDYCYGITYQNQSLFFCTAFNGLRKMNIQSGSVSDFPFKFTTVSEYYVWSTYISSHDNFIVHSDHFNNSVTCLELGGKIKWTYCNTEVLNKPQGITVDSSSNIYVAGSASNNVVIISSDGTMVRQLLGPADGLIEPYAIFFDKDKKELLVVNHNGPAFLYGIQ